MSAVPAVQPTGQPAGGFTPGAHPAGAPAAPDGPSAASAGGLPPGPSAEDFVGGAPWRYTLRDEVTTVRFDDDAWYPLDRLPPDGTKARAKIQFGGFAPWLRPWAKRFIAHQWLERRKSAQQLKLMEINLGRLQDILAGGEGPDGGESFAPFAGPVESLTRFHGERVAAVLLRRARAGAQVQRAMVGRPMGEFHAAIQAAGALVPESVVRLAGHLNTWAAWLRRDPQVVRTDFAVQLSREVAALVREMRDLGADVSKVVADETLTAVLAACAREVAALAAADAHVEAARAAREQDANAADADERRQAGTRRGATIGSATVRARAAYNRAVMSQAVRLQFLAARRRAGVAMLPDQPQIETPQELVEGHKVVRIWFTAYKEYGDDGAPELIPFPGFMGEEALDAVRTAQDLTARVRGQARPEDRGRLFLLYGLKGVRPMSGDDLQKYLNSRGKLSRGLVQRYGIRGAEALTSHNARHTNATRIVEAGGSVILAARYLGHLVTDNNPLMALLFYVAGGTPGMRDRMVRELEAGAGSGRTFDAVARVAVELAGGEAAAAPIPPNQLSFEQALARLRTARLIEEDDVTADQVLRRLKNGYVLNVTRYGGCFLQATSGPCLTPEKCVIGVDPESAETQAGEGCPHQVLMPHALEHLREEAALMEVQIAFFEADGNYAFWLARERRQLAIWRKQIARAEALELLLLASGAPAQGAA